MRTPANDGAGYRRLGRRSRDVRADADERSGQPARAGSVGRDSGEPGARVPEATGRRSSRPHEGLGWDAANRAGLSRRELRQRDRGDVNGAARPGPEPTSVFAPDFSRGGPDPAQPSPGRMEAAGISRTAAGGAPPPPRSWYESPTAARGPVRGYPPAPGQPQPLYPPGQFEAWNRRRDRAAGYSVPGGPEVGPAADGDPAEPRAADQSGDLPSGPLSRYFAGDTDPGPNPGYPTLAVSDPAADVTSTQTWSALADGRATGIWAAPAGLRGPATGKPAPGATPGGRSTRARQPGAAQRPPPRLAVGRPGAAADLLPRPPAVTANGHGSAEADLGTGAGAEPQPGARRTSGRHGGARSEAQTRFRKASPSGDSPGADTERAGPRSRRRPGSVHLAIAAASVLILAAAGTLAYTVLHDSAKPGPAPRSAAKNTASASASPSLGQYGDIASRQTDPQPVTLAELYPASFSVAGDTVTSAATNLSGTCGSALVGATLQSAVGAAGCTQVARASYVSQSGIMATIGVLNLISGDAAKTAAQSADASDYISQLAAAAGPAKDIGQGTGIEEAAAKGHYLILIWAELTSQATPSTQQTAQIESFMTALLQNTVNRDLTTRMLTGAP